MAGQTPNRLTRVQAKAATRRRLLDAARAVFLRQGFHGATVDAVAEEAGFTKGAVYSTFAGKGDLFLALYEERIEQRVRAFERIARDGVTAAESGEFNRLWAETLRRDRAWHLALIEFWAAAAREDDLRTRFAAVQKRLRDVMARIAAEQVAASSGAADFDPDLFARAHAALGNGFALEGFSDPALVRGDAYERAARALDRAFGLSFDDPPPKRGGGGRR